MTDQNVKIGQRRLVGGSPKLTLIIRQLSTLMGAGIPLLRGLETLIKQEKDTKNKELLAAMAESIRGGRSFSDTAEGYPKVFDSFFISMIRAGEAGGHLDIVLSQLAAYREKQMETKSKVVNAMIYPIIVMVVAAVIVSLLMIYIVPQFEGIYGDMLKGQELPGLTRMVVEFSRLISGHLWMKVGGLGLLWSLGVAMSKTMSGREFMDRIMYRAPGIRAVTVRLATLRFTRTFGTLIGTGVPLLKAFRIGRDVVGNRWAMGALDVVHDRVRDGESIAEPLGQTAVFPEMVPSMIGVGEETGRLTEMCERIADNYERELEKVILGFTAALEPILIVLLALVIGVIVIALFLPMVGVLENMG